MKTLSPAQVEAIRSTMMIHICATGPVSFESIHRYIRQQCAECESWVIARLLNELIVKGHIAIYDTGDAFDAVDCFPSDAPQLPEGGAA